MSVHRKFHKRALISVLIVAVIGVVIYLFVRDRQDQAEEPRLLAAYVQLQEAIRSNDFETAYSLMSKKFKETHPFGGFVAMHKAVPNYYLSAKKSSAVAVKVGGSEGIVSITVHVQKEVWRDYYFVKEDGNWRCTGRERSRAQGWD